MTSSLPGRAMILAAGLGKRLRPLTTYFAKPAIPLMGRPLIEYTLRRLAREGVREIVVNLHHRPETLEASLERADPEVTIHRSFEPELLGTAGGLKNAERFLRDGSFLLLNGDTLANVELSRLMDLQVRTGARAALLLRPKPAGASYSGIRLGEDGRIVELDRSGGSAGLMFAGVWLLDSSVLDWLSGQPGGLENELLPRLIGEGSAFGLVWEGSFVTMDTPRRYWEQALSVARDGRFEEDWVVRRRPIEVVAGAAARVLAGADTRVHEGVRFGGVVVLGARCGVSRGARLENVVCWDEVSIGEGVALENCVLTHGVVIPEGAQLRDKVILSLGEDCSRLRRREIHDGLVVADLKIGRTAGL